MPRSRSSVVILVALVVGVLCGAAAAAGGALDRSFAGDGRKTADFGSGDDRANGVAVQNDGRIVVVGSGYDGKKSDFALARFRPGGKLDPTFGTGGRVLTSFLKPGATASESARDVAIQGDGKIVVAGGSGGDFAVARYTRTGHLDSTFQGGRVRTDFGNSDVATGVAVGPGGKIVAFGYSGLSEIAVARYTATGKPDHTFGGDGKVITSFESIPSLETHGVAVQPDGKVLGVGWTGTDQKFLVVRFRPLGRLDRRFNGDGKAITGFGPHTSGAYDVALRPDGKIAVSGWMYDEVSSNYHFALARFTRRGQLDHSFGGDGRVTTDFGIGGEEAYGVAVQADGKTVAAGYTTGPTTTYFAVARYRRHGGLDHSFSGDGKVHTRFSEGRAESKAVAIALNGRIIVVGSASKPSDDDFAVARYLSA